MTSAHLWRFFFFLVVAVSGRVLVAYMSLPLLFLKVSFCRKTRSTKDSLFEAKSRSEYSFAPFCVSGPFDFIFPQIFFQHKSTCVVNISLVIWRISFHPYVTSITHNIVNTKQRTNLPLLPLLGYYCYYYYYYHSCVRRVKFVLSVRLPSALSLNLPNLLYSGCVHECEVFTTSLGSWTHQKSQEYSLSLSLPHSESKITSIVANLSLITAYQSLCTTIHRQS